MSRRTTREDQRLAENLAQAISSQPAYNRRLSAAEARRIRLEAEQERKERRASSAVTLLQPQWMPWALGLIVFVLGAVTWLMRWLSDDPLLPLFFAAMVVALIAWAGWMAGRRTAKWRGSVHRAAAAASVWLLFASATGPSWKSPLVLMVAVVLSSSSWWKANRPKHPKAPSRAAVPVLKDQSIPVLWAENLGAPGCVLPGSYLDDADTSRANCEAYRLNNRPGKQTITGTIAQLELIAGGLLTPVKNLVLEPHEDHNPNHLKLTVVRNSPIDKTVEYSGARIAGDHRHMIEVGPYGDGDGFATWRMWAPGEQPMTGSWLSGFIVGGTGIGKSRLMELLAAGYMASGNAIVWFADPQGGASSPALKEYADWYVDAEGTARMLHVLELIAEAREMENSVEGWTRFDPSPQRPGIVVFLDECQVTFGKYGKRWANLARKTQKVGISFVGLTQYASLDSLGGQEPLRASLLANAIVMKANSKENKNLIAGLEVDPEALPKIPGFGYVIGTDGTRTAPFRAEYLADPARWFEQYRMPALDPLSANAAGDSYQMRRETQAELHEVNRQKVAAMRGGTYQPQLDEPDLDDEGTDDQPAAYKVMQFPAAVAPPEKPARDRVLVAVAQGITRTKEIGDAVGLGKSQLHDVLKELLESKELERPTAGVYAIAGSASPPER